MLPTPSPSILGYSHYSVFSKCFETGSSLVQQRPHLWIFMGLLIDSSVTSITNAGDSGHLCAPHSGRRPTLLSGRTQTDFLPILCNTLEQLLLKNSPPLGSSCLAASYWLNISDLFVIGGCQPSCYVV